MHRFCNAAPCGFESHLGLLHYSKDSILGPTRVSFNYFGDLKMAGKMSDKKNGNGKNGMKNGNKPKTSSRNNSKKK